ncbi:MAG: ATP cone domain-containing protein, partial [Acidimicrobiales bacterium]
HERATEAAIFVLKRSGQREAFEREKVVSGIRAACKNRPVSSDQIEALASKVEELAREHGREVKSEQVGLAVLEGLRGLDDVASVRFASVYKGFEDVGDFARELGLLGGRALPDMSVQSLEKQTAPKRQGEETRE